MLAETSKEYVNYSPAARDLQILLVFCQHPAWFISLLPIETCGLLLKYAHGKHYACGRLWLNDSGYHPPTFPKFIEVITIGKKPVGGGKF